MADSDRTAPSQDSSSSFMSDSFGPASAFPSSSQIREEEWRRADEREEQRRLMEQQNGVAYNGHTRVTGDGAPASRPDTWSSISFVFTFWFFASMTLKTGIYGSVTLRLGPHCSLLLDANPLFVEYIEVEELNETRVSPMLYGFYKAPLLNAITTWSENYDVSLPAGSHRERVYILNEGSQMNISYVVNSSSASHLILVIAAGDEGFSQWLEDPLYPNNTLSWNIIRGSGTIQLDVIRSSSYYVAVGNLNSEEKEVKLILSMKGVLYDTTEAYYSCDLSQESCRLKLLFPFPQGSAALLTTPGLNQGMSTGQWYVKVSYGLRWTTYLVALGGIFALLFAFHYMNKQRTNTEGTRVQFGERGPERTSLLSHKDDDLSSRGSSCDSILQDEGDLEDTTVVGPHEGKPDKDGEHSNNLRRLCAICFDAPRDCFFIPCGHCVACFTCGTRISEIAGTCPICRRNMKKVKRIYTV